MKKKIITGILMVILILGMTGITSFAEATFNFNFAYSSTAQYSQKGFKNHIIPYVTVSAQDHNLSETKKIYVNLVRPDYSAITSTKTLGPSTTARFLTTYEGYLHLKGSPNGIGARAFGVWSTP